MEIRPVLAAMTQGQRGKDGHDEANKRFYATTGTRLKIKQYSYKTQHVT